MANNYKIILQTQLDFSNLQAQIEAKTKNNIVLFKAQLDAEGLTQFNVQLDKIKEKATSIKNISFTRDDQGKAIKAVVDYTDKMNNAVKATILLGKEVKVTETATQNLAKDAKALETAFMNAQKFITQYSIKTQTPQVKEATATAKQIQSTILSGGDVAVVGELTKKFELQKSAITNVKSSWQSLTDSMKQNFKVMVESAISFGVIYGALNQIRQGVQYVKDLNKEMVNIQLVTGGSDAEVGKLALSYNELAKNMSVTTLEIAKGSLEFVRQGKTAEETAILIKNSTMMSKLGNMEAAQSSEALTSIINGFKLSAQN